MISNSQYVFNSEVSLFNTRWQYLINVAGQAFPLKSNLELVEILKTYNGHNDIEGLYGRTISSRFTDEFIEVKGLVECLVNGLIDGLVDGLLKGLVEGLIKCLV